MTTVGFITWGSLTFLGLYLSMRRPKRNAKPNWRGRKSIYAFILNNIDPDSGQLPMRAERLPDEEIFFEDKKERWEPGGMDCVLVNRPHGSGSEKWIHHIARLLVSISRDGDEAEKEKLYRLLQDAFFLHHVELALEKAIQTGLKPGARLHGFARFLARETPDRNPVKFGIALLGLIQDPDDIELIMTLGKHEELTLFSAAALINALEDPEPQLLELAKQVHGWGRIHLVGKLAETKNARIKDWLIREGYRNNLMDEMLAFTCATGGDLAQALQAEKIDQELYESATDILEAMFTDWPDPHLETFADAADLINAYLRHVPHMANSRKQFTLLNTLRKYLSRSEYESRVPNKGWTQTSWRQPADRVEALMEDLDWPEIILQDLANAPNVDQFFETAETADSLNLDTWDAYWRHLVEDHQEYLPWLFFMHELNSDRIDDVLQLAIERLQIREISEAAQDSASNSDYEFQACLDGVLQALEQFPGKGREFILCGLRRPTPKSREWAAAALANWNPDMIDETLQSALLRALESETDKDARKRMKQVSMSNQLLS